MEKNNHILLYTRLSHSSKPNGTRLFLCSFDTSFLPSFLPVSSRFSPISFPYFFFFRSFPFFTLFHVISVLYLRCTSPISRALVSNDFPFYNEHLYFSYSLQNFIMSEPSRGFLFRSTTEIYASSCS